MATEKDGGQHPSSENPSATGYDGTSNITPNRQGGPNHPFVPPDIPDPEGPPWTPDVDPLHGVGPPSPLPSRPPWAPPPQNPAPPGPYPEPFIPLSPDHILPPDPHGPPYPNDPPFSPYAPPGPPQPLIPPFPPGRNRPPPCPPEAPEPDADIQPGGPRNNSRYPPGGRGPTYLNFKPPGDPSNSHERSHQSKQ